jgi:IS605 OrfB family transposase
MTFSRRIQDNTNMVITKTARQKLRNYTRYLDYTLDIYRAALQYVNQIVHAKWINIKQLSYSKQRVNYVEHLIHSTANNTAVYVDFDARFYKFPSYLRRMIVAEAIGNVSSYMTRYKQWEEKNMERIASGKKPKGKLPVFNPKCNSFPVFYKDGMSMWLSNGKVALKLYNGSDWIWFVLPFEPINLDRFPHSEGWERQNPMLVKKNRRWYLHMPFERNVKLPNKDFIRPVLSVDLGLNHTAVCSVVYSDGTVTHREFLPYEGEKDRLDTRLGRITEKSKQTWLIAEGEGFCKSAWRKVGNTADEIAHQCSRKLVEIANAHNYQTIVFEHLGKLKVPKSFRGVKKLRKKLHYWMQGRIQKYTKYKAHAEGIRFSKVLARGTSQYAYDGSGEIIRVGNKQCAIFMDGKTYNADLSASYNIGARYWIRELSSKILTGNSKVAVEDKSSFTSARHQQTLASLISLNRLTATPSNTGYALYSGQGFSPKGETATIAAA